MIAPFHVGQRVVAIKNHSQGVFKKGDEFTILSIKKSCCQHEVDIGLTPINNRSSCLTCKRISYGHSKWWVASKMFAPIQEISNETFESIEQWITEQENAVARSGVPTLCEDFDKFINEQYLSTDEQFENDLL